MGKSSGTGPPPPPVVAPPAPGIDPEMMMMMMSVLGAGAPEPPSQPILPEVYREPEIDWTEKNKTLAAKMKADYKTDQANKKGRSQTTHTSPLLDEEEATVGGSIITGSTT